MVLKNKLKYLENYPTTCLSFNLISCNKTLLAVCVFLIKVHSGLVSELDLHSSVYVIVFCCFFHKICKK